MHGFCTLASVLADEMCSAKSKSVDRCMSCYRIDGHANTCSYYHSALIIVPHLRLFMMLVLFEQCRAMTLTRAVEGLVLSQSFRFENNMA